MARAIDMMRMKRPGGAGAVLQLIASTYRAEDVSPGGATASFVLATTGAATGLQELVAGSDSYNWLTDGSAALYEVIVVLLSGTFSSGAAGTFPLNVDREWSVSKSGAVGIKTTNASYSIRRISDGLVMVPATEIRITAQITF